MMECFPYSITKAPITVRIYLHESGKNIMFFIFERFKLCASHSAWKDINYDNIVYIYCWPLHLHTYWINPKLHHSVVSYWTSTYDENKIQPYALITKEIVCYPPSSLINTAVTLHSLSVSMCVNDQSSLLACLYVRYLHSPWGNKQAVILSLHTELLPLVVVCWSWVDSVCFFCFFYSNYYIIVGLPLQSH